ncbi:hypothetical protein ACF0H5_009826 [Mactra antiquata]
MENIVLLLIFGILIHGGSTYNFVVKELIQEVLREKIDDNRTVLNEFIEERQNDGYVYETDMTIESHPPPPSTPCPFAKGLVSCDCLRCICLLESKCKPIGCVMDVGSLSCGYFQIKEPYWIDCGKPGKDWKSCADDIQCASTCVQKYMARYAARYGCPATCEGYAREHNGGPKGCKNPNTMGYWKKVQLEPGCKDVKN